MKDDDKASDKLEEGYEALESDNYQQATECFYKVIEMDSSMGEAYRGLGEVFQSINEYRKAEKFYKKAITAEKRNLGSDEPDAHVWWSDMETRPYLRARESLAFLYWDEGKYEKAIHEFREILRRNKNDDQGVRFHIPSLYLLNGNLAGAMGEFDLYYKNYPDDIPEPQILYNRALTVFSLGLIEQAVHALRAAFFSNMYVPSLILIQAPSPADIYFKTNIEEPEYGMEYCAIYRELWCETPGAISFMNKLWNHSEIAIDITQYLQVKRDIATADSDKKAERLSAIAEKIENKSASEVLATEMILSFRNREFSYETDNEYFREQEEDALRHIVTPIEGEGKLCTPDRFIDLLYGLLYYEGMLTMNDAFFYMCDVLELTPGVNYKEILDRIEKDERLCTELPDVVYRSEVEIPLRFLEFKVRHRPEFPREYTINELDAALRGEVSASEYEVKLLELIKMAGKTASLEELRKVIRNSLYQDITKRLHIMDLPGHMHDEIKKQLEKVWMHTSRYELWGASPIELIVRMKEFELAQENTGGKVTPFRRPTGKA